MCGVKRRRLFIVLFKLHSIRWFMKMSVWSLACQQSVFHWYHSEKHLSEFYPQDGGESQLALKLRHCHSMYTCRCADRQKFSSPLLQSCVLLTCSLPSQRCGHIAQIVVRLYKCVSCRRRTRATRCLSCITLAKFVNRTSIVASNVSLVRPETVNRWRTVVSGTRKYDEPEVGWKCHARAQPGCDL